MRPNVPMLRFVVLLAVAVALPAFASNAPSEHYRWKDSAGVVHFSDIIPASALAGGYDVVDNQGRVVRHVGRELTPAERRAAAAEAAKLATAKRAAQKQQLADSQMMSAFPTDKALITEQQGELKQIEIDIKTLNGNLATQESALTDLLTHAADMEHAGKVVPHGVNERIAEQRGVVNGERAQVAQRRADLVAAKARFADQLARYRMLRAKYADPATASSR